MGRLDAGRLPVRRWATAVGLALALSLAGCSPGGPSRVTLAELTTQTDEHDGSTVETSGIVREFTENDALMHHVVIEDADQNRVELHPLEAGLPYVDEEVTVVGEFAFDPGRGRGIQVESIEPTGG